MCFIIGAKIVSRSGGRPAQRFWVSTVDCNNMEAQHPWSHRLFQTKTFLRMSICLLLDSAIVRDFCNQQQKSSIVGELRVRMEWPTRNKINLDSIQPLKTVWWSQIDHIEQDLSKYITWRWFSHWNQSWTKKTLLIIYNTIKSIFPFGLEWASKARQPPIGF